MLSLKSKWLPLAACVTLVVGLGLPGTAHSEGEREPKGSPEFKAAWKKYSDGEAEPQLAFHAIAENEAASKIDRFNSRYVMGVIALGHGAFDMALEQLDAAEKLIPNRPQVNLRRAEVLIAKKDHKGAAEELKKTKGIKKGSPLFPVYQIAMARLEAATENPAKAIARLEEMCKLQKNSWESHFVLATLYETQEQPQKALASYAMVIELDPKKDPTGAIYAYQRWAALALASDPNSYSKKELMATARQRYATFLERAPKNNVPAALVQATEQMMSVFDYFK